MKVIGVIAEYNPFHLGHLYQINKIKERYPDSIIIAILSGYFMERGELSVLSKWDKTELALSYGIDLVVELPTLYATQAADLFAYGSINILADLGIDTLVFGSERENINDLIVLAKTQINNIEYDKLVKDYMDKGLNYPTAISKTLYRLTNIMVSEPNDLLAVSYLKEIFKNNYQIEPINIKRTNDYHGKNIDSKIVNASLIRELYYQGKDIKNYLPDKTLNYMKRINIDMAFTLLKYQILINRDSLRKYLDVDEGIDNRILKYFNEVNSWQELVLKIKTKRYTYNKINRILIHILLDIKKDDNIKELYIRLLGFNKQGRKYLNTRKKELKLSVFTNYKSNLLKTLDIDYKSAYIYSLLVNDLSLVKKEFQGKPIIK